MATAWSVAVAETVTGPLQVGEDAVAVVPSVVQWMVAPAVVEEIVTFWAVVYVPAAGENVGVAARGEVPWMVYVAVASALAVWPGAVAMAWSVVVAETVTGSLQVWDDAVAVEPSVVQWTVAPAVALTIVTCTAVV